MGVRFVKPEDAEKILNIYSYYIVNTEITFECEVPDLKYFREKICSISCIFPYLVYEEKDEIIGFSYAAPFHERQAFNWSAEVSIYLKPEYTGKKIGVILYEKLFEILKKQNIINVYATISYPYQISEKFHKKMGFSQAALFKNTGFKHGKWLDLLYTEKRINELENPPKKFISLTELMTDRS